MQRYAYYSRWHVSEKVRYYATLVLFILSYKKRSPPSIPTYRGHKTKKVKKKKENLPISFCKGKFSLLQKDNERIKILFRIRYLFMQGELKFQSTTISIFYRNRSTV
jgi:hypothetical protein